MQYQFISLNGYLNSKPLSPKTGLNRNTQSLQVTSLVKETEKLRFQIIRHLKKKKVSLLLQYFLLVDAGLSPGILNFISH